MKRRPVIQVEPGTVPKMCKVFGCKRTAVYDALSFKTHSDLANAIRHNAITIFGGVKTTKPVFK